MKNFANTDFYTRAAKFEERKGKDLDQIKTTMVDPDQEEYTFKPKISKNAKKIKRNIDDLYNWNKEKQKKLEKMQKEKQKKEEEEIELNQQAIFVNNKSKILLTKKSRMSSKNYNDVNDFGNIDNGENNNINTNTNENEDINVNMNMNNNNNSEIAFDLWPNYLERKFYDENEIPLNNNKEKEGEGAHPLNYEGNKDESNRTKKGYEEESEEDEEENNDNTGYNDYHNINNDE